MKLKDKITNKQFFELFPSAITDFNLWDQTMGANMDALYFGNHSGEKPCSPLMETWAGTMSQIVQMVYSKYWKNWVEEKRYLIEEYELYDDVATETRTISSTDNQKPNNWKTTVQGLAADNEVNTETNTFGFNSSTAVPDGTAKTTSKNKQETTQSGNYQTDHRMTENFERHASSLAKTPADMLASDDRFWSSWNYFERIFKDTDRELTCPFYE